MSVNQMIAGVAPRQHAGNALLVAAVVALFAIAATLCGLRKDVTHGFDEVAHASYVAQLQDSRSAWLPLEDLRLLDPSSFRFTERPSYLNHPSPYYALLAWLGPTLDGHPSAIVYDRLINVMLDTIALALLLAIALAAGIPKPEFYAYVIPLGCIPVLPALAGAVNNDNLGFAGGAVATFAAYKLLTDRHAAWLAAALAGLVVAAWAKLTGLLLVGGMLAMVLGWTMLRGRLRWTWAAVAFAAAVVAAAPYVIFTLRYGGPIPDTPGYLALLTITHHPEARMLGTARLSFPAYLAHFAAAFMRDWLPSLAPRSTLNDAMLAIPVATLLAAVAGIGCAARRLLRGADETALDVLAVAGGAAIAATLMLHIAYSYQRHLATGWLLDAYPRYYLPLAAAIPLAGLSLLSTVRERNLRAALLALFIAGPIAFRILGGPLA